MAMVWPLWYVLSSLPSSSKLILKKYISNVSRPIVIKLHVYNEQGHIRCISDCIGHMVAMSTLSFHRLMMGNL